MAAQQRLAGFAFAITVGIGEHQIAVMPAEGITGLGMSEQEGARRRFAVCVRNEGYEAALERRRAMQEAARAEADAHDGHDSELPFEEPPVDLSTLSDEARELIRTVVSVAGLIGLYLIWEDALPALRVLDDIVLWHTSATVDGTEQTQPVTLAAVGLALIYGIAAWLLKPVGESELLGAIEAALGLEAQSLTPLPPSGTPDGEAVLARRLEVLLVEDNKINLVVLQIFNGFFS